MHSATIKIKRKLYIFTSDKTIIHDSKYTAFGMWWHTVTHGRGSEGESGEGSV